MGIMCIYASKSRREKQCKTIVVDTKEGQWLIARDFNMTEKRIDLLGPLPLIRGREKEEWRLLHNRFKLKDAFDISRGASRSRFTQRGLHGFRLDQSWIDRMYCLE